MIHAPFVMTYEYLIKTVLAVGVPISAVAGTFWMMGDAVQLEIVKQLPAILFAASGFVAAISAALVAIIQMIRGIKTAVGGLVTKTDTLTEKADTLTVKAKENQDAIATGRER